MILKNRVALYSATRRKLTYGEVIERMNDNKMLFILAIVDGELLYIKVPDRSSFRDVEWFAKGVRFLNPSITIERCDYIE